jgi:hypothetical protein
VTFRLDLLGIFITASAEDATACVRQAPKPVFAGITQSPFSRPDEAGGVEVTSNTPSLPRITEGAEVPISELKVGFAP